MLAVSRIDPSVRAGQSRKSKLAKPILMWLWFSMLYTNNSEGKAPPCISPGVVIVTLCSPSPAVDVMVNNAVPDVSLTTVRPLDASGSSRRWCRGPWLHYRERGCNRCERQCALYSEGTVAHSHNRDQLPPAGYGRRFLQHARAQRLAAASYRCPATDS